MGDALRKSMAWLHTWAGVVLGSLLFSIFWMGTLSVFDREIDRWMQPGTRLPPPPAQVSLDGAVLPVAQSLAPGSAQWGVTLPTRRAPHLRFFYLDGQGQFIVRAIDPRSGALIPDQGSEAGTGFIFPWHFKLNIQWADLGYWLVGAAGMAMLALLVSGVVIHKKIFIDFFLFRPRKQLQRASLDLHNLMGVLALPFHFTVTLSGLVIFMGVYFPHAHVGAYGFGQEAKAQYLRDAYGGLQRDKAGTPAAMASLDGMLARAGREWPGGKAYFVRVWNPGDANAYVEVRRSYADDITMNLDQLFFDAATGAVLQRFEAAPVMSAQRFISGLHFVQFDHWGLRWLYFAGGLSGCVLIATGFLFWLESRRARHARRGLAGVRVVEALTVGSVTGILVATLCFMVVNRLLPLDAGFAGQSRAELEMWAFYIAWVLTFAHAARRPADPTHQPARTAWRQQCWAVAGLSLAAVALNGWTTGDHLAKTVGQGRWSVAGVDAVLLAACGVAAWAALRLRAGVPRPSRMRAPPEAPAPDGAQAQRG